MWTPLAWSTTIGTWQLDVAWAHLRRATLRPAASGQCKQREFGKLLFDLQTTRLKLAECEITARMTRAFVDQCVVKHLKRELSAADASMAKCWATDQFGRVADECLQLHGGYGYMTHTPIARLYADAQAAPTSS
jgi:alkylation response protein AidB-like acyl-CoA dehydrogenase